MSLLEETKFLLRKHRIAPKKALGQNFMIDASFFQCLVDHASLNKGDVVLDIGAGFGFLTRFVASRCKVVLAVEADPTVATVLREQLIDVPNARVIEGDILDAAIPRFSKVISIPPYNISSELLLWLFRKNFGTATLVLQKEFAERLVALPRSEDYGWLTVLTYQYLEVELLGSMPRTAFYPQPKIASIIVLLKRRKQRPFPVKDGRMFKEMLQFLFARRNRKIRNVVSTYLRVRRHLTKEAAAEIIVQLPFRDGRPRELAPKDFGELADALGL